MKRITNHAMGRLGMMLSVALCAVLLTLPAMAQPSGLRDDAPSRYTVVEGDTLWSIAGRFLNAPWEWREVWRVNSQIRNPHLIYPGDSVYLYYQDGQPRLGLERGQGDVVHLSPEVRRVPHREAIAPLPLDTVLNFLDANRIVEPGAIEAVPYVVAGDDRRIISGAGDRIYVRGELPMGERFGLYRPGQRYEDPETGEFLGLELVTLGEARFVRRDGDIALLEVVSSRQEIRGSDLVLPLEALPVTAAFQPRAPAGELEGRILSVPGGVRFVGRLEVVALNLGRRDGLEPGHVLAVEQLGEQVVDPVTEELLRLPGEDAGLLMVFRVYDRVSYALVMHATRSLTIGDRVHTPQSNAFLANHKGD
ncbi:LysM domain-containing protein [Modicisalibacter muralis]|uniref:LysM domain-containing protein n=1 Tax=Modicisalibacter muralis TaxID=119000 RepID=A0A1G9JGA1_9GAMM|nr:LysM domain-containing protein [Halomonas muralis]SDL36322.1 LysM domain-containing protein [Halomonas muralis]